MKGSESKGTSVSVRVCGRQHSAELETFTDASGSREALSDVASWASTRPWLEHIVHGR